MVPISICFFFLVFHEGTSTFLAVLSVNLLSYMKGKRNSCMKLLHYVIVTFALTQHAQLCNQHKHKHCTLYKL